MDTRKQNGKNFFEELETGFSNFISSITPDKWAADDLLKQVKDAEWENIAALIETKPHLMLIKVNDIDGSPLEYALGVCDIFTLKIFYQKALSNPEHLTSFKQQAKTKKASFNMKHLLDAYLNILQAYDTWKIALNNIISEIYGSDEFLPSYKWKSAEDRHTHVERSNRISARMRPHNKVFERALKNIGDAQSLLPVHFLKEFCRK